jgi:hypothetical protein
MYVFFPLTEYVHVIAQIELLLRKGHTLPYSIFCLCMCLGC